MNEFVSPFFVIPFVLLRFLQLCLFVVSPSRTYICVHMNPRDTSRNMQWYVSLCSCKSESALLLVETLCTRVILVTQLDSLGFRFLCSHAPYIL